VYKENIAIIVLNWNGKQDTLECLESIRKIDYQNFDVIVVDNGSCDDSVQSIRNKFPEVNVLETGKNLGYAGGNNYGLRYAIKSGADYILLLNNDIIVGSQLLKNFVQAAHRIPHWGMLTAKIYYFSHPNKIWYAGARRIKHTANFMHLGKGCIDNGKDYSSMVETDYACGCALFLRTSLLKKIGLFDERFFLTYEETDLSYRTKALGYKCYLVPEAKVWHKVSVSFGGEHSPLFIYFLTRNSLLWAEIHLSLIERIRLYYNTLRELVQCICPPRPNFSSFQLKLSDMRNYLIIYKGNLINKYTDPIRRAKVWAITHYILRQFGDCSEAVRSLRWPN
jgi:GT2 family glycosyltransferase